MNSEKKKIPATFSAHVAVIERRIVDVSGNLLDALDESSVTSVIESDRIVRHLRRLHDLLSRAICEWGRDYTPPRFRCRWSHGKTHSDNCARLGCSDIHSVDTSPLPRCKECNRYSCLCSEAK